MSRSLGVALFVVGLAPRWLSLLDNVCAERIDIDEWEDAVKTTGADSMLQRTVQHAHDRAVEDSGETIRTKPRTMAKGMQVAFVVVAPYGVKDKPDAWSDGFAVVAHSIRKAEEKSPHKVDILAIVPNDVEDHEGQTKKLAQLGLKSMFVDIPVSLSEVKDNFAREALSKVLGEKEQLKYYGAGLTNYDRVVILDGDTMVLQPIDELFQISPEPGLVGTYDHEMDCGKSAFPPMNSGFAVFTPDKADFKGLADVFREGDFTGLGFRKSGTGYTYGAGSQGMLSFFYNQWKPGSPGVDLSLRLDKRGTDLPADGEFYGVKGFNGSIQPRGSRFHPVDRSMYDVIQTDSLLQAVEKGLASADRVKVMHFAGQCMKPWMCTPTRTTLCSAMTDAWWKLRDEVRQSRGLPEAARCEPYKTEYKALELLDPKDI